MQRTALKLTAECPVPLNDGRVSSRFAAIRHRAAAFEVTPCGAVCPSESCFGFYTMLSMLVDTLADSIAYYCRQNLVFVKTDVIYTDLKLKSGSLSSLKLLVIWGDFTLAIAILGKEQKTDCAFKYLFNET